MIPRHRPPFGIVRVLWAGADPSRGPSVARIEREFASAFAVPEAVLLPSVRAGLCWALQARGLSGCPVACPVYTCEVVHEAVIRAGCPLELIDVAEDGFLMPTAEVEAALARGRAIILCEIYGHPYDLAAVARAGSPAATRIIDMAMTVPTVSLVSRLTGGDLGLLSFGIGKCVYSGWGGMAFTRDAALADEIRGHRDSHVRGGGGRLAVKRFAEVALRTIAHHGLIYRWMRSVQGWRLRHAGERCILPPAGPSPSPVCAGPPSAEWRLPSTRVDRRLIRHNIHRVDRYRERRVRLAERYRQVLAESAGLRLPPACEHALSHFTIRVPAHARSAMRAYLWRRGIDAGAMFHFPGYVQPGDCPRARQLAQEVLNLPLSPNLSEHDVDRIARAVLAGLKEVGG